MSNLVNRLVPFIGVHTMRNSVFLVMIFNTISSREEDGAMMSHLAFHVRTPV